jgi:hypothetical protein
MPSRIECLGLTEEATGILKYLDYQPTKEECERYSNSHTRMHAGKHFYLFKFNRGAFGLTAHAFSSDSMHSSNILNLMNRSLEDGSFVSLEKITIKQYAQHGGGDVPCCIRNCTYEGDWPPCIKMD